MIALGHRTGSSGQVRAITPSARPAGFPAPEHVRPTETLGLTATVARASSNSIRDHSWGTCRGRAPPIGWSGPRVPDHRRRRRRGDPAGPGRPPPARAMRRDRCRPGWHRVGSVVPCRRRSMRPVGWSSRRRYGMPSGSPPGRQSTSASTAVVCRWSPADGPPGCVGWGAPGRRIRHRGDRRDGLRGPGRRPSVTGAADRVALDTSAAEALLSSSHPAHRSAVASLAGRTPVLTGHWSAWPRPRPGSHSSPGTLAPRPRTGRSGSCSSSSTTERDLCRGETGSVAQPQQRQNGCPAGSA